MVLIISPELREWLSRSDTDRSSSLKNTHMNKKQLILKQIDLNEEVKRLADINIVTCGDCGSVVLHKLKAKKIACPYCESVMLTGDFPDLLYIGMEIN